MSRARGCPVVIVDYGLGNLHNVLRACEAVGMAAKITSSPDEIGSAPAAILPGVGAFADAIAVLESTGMADSLRELVNAGKPLFGICLGFQLLMTESCEFGHHQGLNFIPGSVRRIDHPTDGSSALKVPHVGWNRVWRKSATRAGSLIDAIADGENMYFAHSFVVVPADPQAIVSSTRYGDVEFCSSAARGNVFGCQFHPERSGVCGLKMYARFAHQVGQASDAAVPSSATSHVLPSPAMPFAR
jgi:glutamine amidotransferase